jgi:poly(glycerol-phosphate) alpha-glucosyltransferase
VTWSIPDDFGGMTRAMLQRSQAFVHLGRVTVGILTFDARPDYPDVERRLREAGELTDGMRLHNLYEWLRVHPLPGGSLRLERHPLDPLPRTGDAPTERRLAADGTVLQIDHYRRDGVLLLSDRRDVRQQGVLGGRSVVLCGEAGVPVRSWGRIHHLYRAWLDRLTATQPSYLVVDSKTIAGFMMGYRRPHATTVHVVHNSHRGPDDGFRSSRRAVLENAAAFDSVVVLTERQRDDLRALVGSGARLSVIPNAVPLPDRADDRRDVRRGIVLASLTSRKRVGHAVSAMLAAAPQTGAHLDVYGDGEQRDELERLASLVPGAVALHGYRRGARDELRSASFLLATGTSEGTALALVESMAAGCLPIAYDVPYGPADVIDGRNGVLVPSGDVSALADAIRTLVTESPARLERRRRHARRTALRYTDEAVTASWGRELRAARRRHASAFAPQHRDGFRHASRAGLLRLRLGDRARVLLAVAVRQLLPRGRRDRIRRERVGEVLRNLHLARRVVPHDRDLHHLTSGDTGRGAVLRAHADQVPAAHHRRRVAVAVAAVERHDDRHPLAAELGDHIVGDLDPDVVAALQQGGGERAHARNSVSTG